MKRVKIAHRCPVMGIIIANEWDVDGNITDVVIYADNEEIYLVTKKESTQNLSDAVQKRVKILGEIIELSNGHKIIDVKSLKVIKDTDGRYDNTFVKDVYKED